MSDIKQRLKQHADAELLLHRQENRTIDPIFADTLAEIERLEKVEDECRKLRERLGYADIDNDNHWKWRAVQAKRLESVIDLLKQMRRAAGEDS